MNKRSRKRKLTSSHPHADSDTIFTLLLASLSNPNPNSNTNSLIKNCLNNFPLSKHQIIPIPILSLLPVLLTSNYDDAIVCRTAEIVGQASLLSLEMNEQLALDCDIVKCLVSVLAAAMFKRKDVSVRVCNAVLDLSTTSLGRERLLQFSALETLMFGFLQVSKSSIPVFLSNVEKGSVACLKLAFKADEFPILLLDAAIILINTCNIEQLEKIPRKLSDSFLVFLQELWAVVHHQMLHGSIFKSNQGVNFYLSNIRIYNLAEGIFRLSINTVQFTNPSTCEAVKGSIFGMSNSSFKDFMLKNWESSPFLVRDLSKGKIEKDDVFGSVVKSLNCNEPGPSFLSSILQSMVSCPPIASDELNILSFLKEMRTSLGCPMIYQQDIRALKTESHSTGEVHFFRDCSDSCYSKGPLYICIEDIMKCEDAFREGYTIALRGMEFRFKSIAAIADGLASLFGQPSVGANIYLTPPNSQGLARHYDDHCVFVCQLFGTKQWKISCHPNMQLPRLYDSLDSLQSSENETSMAACTQISLREGDILYIPRGFSHEALTENCEQSGSAGFSLHLTLGIEVEPPFEWEGFAHIALYCWNQTQKQTHQASVESLSGILDVMSVNLLHVMIGLFGESDPIFRKACLVAAISLQQGTNDWLHLNQKIIFNHVITRISKSRFSDAFLSGEMAIKKNEDPFQRMRWIRLLSQERKTIDEYDGHTPLMGMGNLLPVYAEQKETAELAFNLVKSKFCCEVLFEDVIGSYLMLLEKYKKARKQYGDGMLSLHL
ncbi:Cupin_4 domain-containing protein [Cephalotus follicularis]|uniref:Bifunctional lysine-specific demethylase and histidyl-hydroxylase n=1 Tax=Cephalotus follicularis TaxID=3775 RepID=A0A1Q3AVF4_CEPFO|nr:Cupin_4 domain-containing protein [Cephalotus follicularis]